MSGKLNIASMLRKSVQKIEQTASEQSVTPTSGPASSKAKDVKKVGERKPKTAKKPAAEKKATASVKKVGAKTKEKKLKPVKEKKEKKDETPYEEKTWQLDQYRKVTMKKFHGQVLFDVREFYMDKLSKEIMPGKKGISLTQDQLKKLKSLFPELDNKFPSFSSSDKPFFDPLA